MSRHADPEEEVAGLQQLTSPQWPFDAELGKYHGLAVIADGQHRMRSASHKEDAFHVSFR
ncbi:hypothetical protein E0T84_14575 [Mycobacterium sp. DBP42]|nr:hypothetical protein E0T84_14575 [Mycobacterium sp. DBP42]